MNIQFRSFHPSDLLTVRKKMPYAMTETTRGVVAYDMVSGETAAIFLAEGWTPNSVMVHQIIIKPFVIRHGWFEEVARFIFDMAGRKKMYGLVQTDNKKARGLNHKLGFNEVCLLEDAVSDGTHYVLMELTKENCPYWNPIEKAA